MTETEIHEAALNAAPSEMRADEPTMARLLAIGGLGLAILGIIAVIANQYGPRIVGTTGGIVCTFLGLALLLYHAFRDGDSEFRLVYTGVGLLALIGAVAVAVLPGREAATVAWQWGYYLIPYAPLVFTLALLFLTAAGRHAADGQRSQLIDTAFLTVAGALTVSPVVIGLAKPELLTGAGLLLALVGILYACAYLSRVGTNDGLGRFVGIAIGIIGGLTLYYAVARTVFPPVLAQGPRAVQTAARTYDGSLLSIRLAIAACLGYAAYVSAMRPTWSSLARTLTAVGLGSIAAVLVVGCFAAPLKSDLPPFLVPGGLVLGLLGLLYLSVSLAYCSDSPFVTLIVREVSSFFVSPIAYLVMIGVSFMAAIGYLILVNQIIDDVRGGQLVEPMVGQYWFAWLGASFLACLVVPAITMRLLSEERRTGTLETLLTSPVSDWQVVLSKFLAAWLFYQLVWVPIGLYLLGLRAAGSVFDERPLLSYYVAHAACGAGFVAMGLFFSSLTRNQIVAAVLTGAGMIALLFTTVIKGMNLGEWFSPLAKAVEKFDFFAAWQSSLNGQLPLSFVVLYLSMAAIWLFATVKVLESRRWA
jgi:ABC-2 type transport system permease protein